MYPKYLLYVKKATFVNLLNFSKDNVNLITEQKIDKQLTNFKNEMVTDIKSTVSNFRNGMISNMKSTLLDFQKGLQEANTANTSPQCHPPYCFLAHTQFYACPLPPLPTHLLSFCPLTYRSRLTWPISSNKKNNYTIFAPKKSSIPPTNLRSAPN